MAKQSNTMKAFSCYYNYHVTDINQNFDAIFLLYYTETYRTIIIKGGNHFHRSVSRGRISLPPYNDFYKMKRAMCP